MEASEHRLSAIGTPRCASCGGVIGVYEPLVHVVDGVAYTTSRAADPQIARTHIGACYHVPCREKGAAEAVTAAA